MLGWCSVRALFVALNDEELMVKALAIMVVGRLALRNPAYVKPALRRHLMQLLNNMKNTTDNNKKEGVCLTPSTSTCSALSIAVDS